MRDIAPFSVNPSYPFAVTRMDIQVYFSSKRTRVESHLLIRVRWASLFAFRRGRCTWNWSPILALIAFLQTLSREEVNLHRFCLTIKPTLLVAIMNFLIGTRLLQCMLKLKLPPHFWKRWSLEYVSELQQRLKWKTNQTSIQAGTLVLVRDKNLLHSIGL